VGWYQKGKTNLDFTEARDSEWQWHQLDHMQVCTSLQTDIHTSTQPLSFLQAGWPSCHPINSVKAHHHLLTGGKLSVHAAENRVFKILHHTLQESSPGNAPEAIIVPGQCTSTRWRPASGPAGTPAKAYRSRWHRGA